MVKSRSNVSSSSRTLALLRSRMSFLSCNMTSTAGIVSRAARNASRARRLARLRSTARRAALRLAIRPKRASTDVLLSARSTKLRFDNRSGPANTRLNSSARVNLRAADTPCVFNTKLFKVNNLGVIFDGHQTASAARPLARRARITARPPRVFMRARKPWVRARFTLEG